MRSRSQLTKRGCFQSFVEVFQIIGAIAGVISVFVTVIALIYAIRHPDRVDVVIDTLAGITPLPTRIEDSPTVIVITPEPILVQELTPTVIPTDTPFVAPTQLPTPTLAEVIVAWDDFETDSPSGGSGWLNDWECDESDCNYEITHDDEPYDGIYHLRNNTYGGRTFSMRAVSLENVSDVSIQFWAKGEGLGGDDYAEFRVSTDGENWLPIQAWTEKQKYRFHKLDLSPFTPTSQLWIRFNVNGHGFHYSTLWIDDIKIVQHLQPAP